MHAADGFVAIRDINPQAETHLLVLPARHVDSFREVGEFPPEEAKRMLDFVAETARAAGARGLPRRGHVGPGAGQTVFTSIGTSWAAACEACRESDRPIQDE